MAKAKQPMILFPFHARIVGEMNLIHCTLSGATTRAMRAIHEITTTSVPRNHVEEVRGAMHGMFHRLGGVDNRRFTKAKRILINKAHKALDQQEQAPETGTAHAGDHTSEHQGRADDGVHPASGNGIDPSHRPVPRQVEQPAMSA